MADSNDMSKKKNKLAQIDHINHKILNIAYDNLSETQKLDLYYPDITQNNFPLVIHIHGGAFLKGDKQDHQLNPFLSLLEHGYVVGSINYRLSGEAIFPAAVQDAKTAIRFLKFHAEKYNLDSNRFAVVGGSAGGNLCAMVGTSAHISEFEKNLPYYGEVDSSVKAVVDWFGPTDFSKMDEQLNLSQLGPCDHSLINSPESRYMGTPISIISKDVLIKADPATYVTDKMPPFLIQHGRLDHLVPYQQSVYLTNRIREVAGDDRVILEIIETADHGTPEFSSKENMKKVVEFLKKYV